MTEIRAVGISGTGMYVPEKILTNDDLSKIVDTNDEWIVKRTGMKNRHIVSDEQATSDLCYEAAKNALEDANVAPEDVDLIIIGTSTPDYILGATACIIQGRLGCVNAGAFDLSAACSGFVYSMWVARNMIATGAVNTALVLGADALTPFVDWEDRNQCVLFGDGAGACVLQPGTRGEILAGGMGAKGDDIDKLHIPGGGSRNPLSRGNERTDAFIHIDGRDIYKFAVNKIGDCLEAAAASQGIKVSDFDWFVPHQVNTRILEAAAKRTGFPSERTFLNIEKYANTSAATIPMAFHEAAKENVFKEGDLIVTVGFGGGLTWGWNVIRW